MKKSNFMRQYEKCLKSILSSLNAPEIQKKGVQLTDIDLKEFEKESKRFANWLRKNYRREKT